jgi:endonuclease YncB( thermonuclease family)
MARFGPYAAVFAAGFAAALLVQFVWRAGREPAREGTQATADLNVVSGGAYRVARVVDGDSIVLDSGLHVRYAGVNTPELGRFVSAPAPLAKEAAARNRELVEGRRVRLTLSETPVDAHGRLIAHAVVLSENAGELDVEAALLREGLARAMGIGLRAGEYERLKALEERAKADKLGIWGAPASAQGDAPARFPFCASSEGRVFHRADCPQAQHISPANFEGYRSMEEALATGRRPCSQCLKEGASQPRP